MNFDLETDKASAQAIFQSYDGMEGLAATITSAQPLPTDWRAFFQRIYPGLLVAGTIALATAEAAA